VVVTAVLVVRTVEVSSAVVVLPGAFVVVGGNVVVVSATVVHADHLLSTFAVYL